MVSIFMFEIRKCKQSELSSAQGPVPMYVACVVINYVINYVIYVVINLCKHNKQTKYIVINEFSGLKATSFAHTRSNWPEPDAGLMEKI